MSTAERLALAAAAALAGDVAPPLVFAPIQQAGWAIKESK